MIKINVQSPGPIEFSSSITQGLIKRLEQFYTAIKNKKLKEKEKTWTSDFKDSSEDLKIDVPDIEDKKKIKS